MGGVAELFGYTPWAGVSVRWDRACPRPCEGATMGAFAAVFKIDPELLGRVAGRQTKQQTLGKSS